MQLKRPLSAKSFLIAPMFMATLLFATCLVFVLNGGLSLKTTDPSKGLVYQGMVLGATHTVCQSGYELLVVGVQEICTHGPDPAPKDVDVRVDRAPAEKLPQQGTQSQVLGSAVSCTGDGQSGDRIQLVYASVAGRANRYNEFANSFQQWVQDMNRALAASAAKTGGTSQIRFVHDSSCVPIIDQLQLSSTGADSFNNTIYESYAAGYNRPDRKYLMWVDANVYCGISTIVNDDRASLDNPNNIQSSWSRVDNGCWGLGDSVELHETSHMLGAVQLSAPHSDGGNHCTDEYDRLCYNSTGTATLTHPCDTSGEALLDCNNDDYFSTSPAPGSYLDTHWNMAKSSYLDTRSPGLSSLTHPDGTLVRAANDSTIYLIEGSIRRYVPSVEVLRSQGYSLSGIKLAVAGDLALPLGDALSLREGILIKGSGPNVYVVANISPTGLTRRLITSSTVMSSLGYTASDVLSLSEGALALPDGSEINSPAMAHPDGTLVISPNGPDIFWIDNGVRRYVSLPEIVASQGLVLRSLRLANSSDLSLPSDSNYYFREGTLIKTENSPNIYVVDYTDALNYRKRLIASGSTFAILGYSRGDTYTVDAATLPVNDGPNL